MSPVNADALLTDRQREMYELGEQFASIQFPPGIEVMHIAGQTIFPDTNGDAISFWLVKKGDPTKAPKVFDGGVLNYGLQVFPGGWALMGFKVEGKSAIEIRRSIEANLPSLEATQ